MSKQIKGSLDEASFKTILVKNKYCTCTDPVNRVHEFNGPKILQLIVNSINPKTCVGVSNYKIEIQNETLQKFNSNLQAMVDFMEANYEEIAAHNVTQSDYTMQIFNALLIYKHNILRSMLQRLKTHGKSTKTLNQTF